MYGVDRILSALWQKRSENNTYYAKKNRNKANERTKRTYEPFIPFGFLFFDKRGLTDSILFNTVSHCTIIIIIHFVHEVVRSIVCMYVCDCEW